VQLSPPQIPYGVGLSPGFAVEGQKLTASAMTYPRKEDVLTLCQSTRSSMAVFLILAILLVNLFLIMISAIWSMVSNRKMEVEC
jgi:hypothetical protein